MSIRFLALVLATVFATDAALAQVRPQTPPDRIRAITQTALSQQEITPNDALDLLIEGNARFLAGRPLERNFLEQVTQTAGGQYPFAFVLGCVDSRAPMEILFDKGIGDLFVGRVAGNFVNTDLLGSMEFATAVAGARLIAVIGHTECGAVKGACDTVRLGNLTQTLSNIAPAVYSVQGYEGARTSANKAFVDAVATENVALTVQNIVDRSAVIQQLIREGRVEIIGGMHEITTGRVTFDPETRVTAQTLATQG